MGSSEERDCNMKHRNIPKLSPEKDSKSEKDGVKAETEEERIARISNVQITFSDFFVKCIDHDMLKLFFGALIFFFFFVGVITMIYLVIIYFFRQSMWNYYFPSEEFHKNAHGEL